MQGFELSVQQRHLWQARGDSRVFRSQCAIELAVAPGVEALRAALRQIVARHEILRTRFHRLPGWSVPVQVIAEEPRFLFEVRELDAAAEQAGPDAWLRAARERPEGEEEPPLYACLLSSPSRHVLLLDLPALHADGRTLRNLVRELMALVSGGQPESGELLQYVDYCEWQREIEEDRAAQGYWKSQLSGFSGDAALPLEREGASEPQSPFAPAVLTLRLGREEAEALETAARQAGATPSLFLLACFHVFMARLTGSEEALVGWLSDGRSYEPMRSAMGPFSRFLPLRCRCDRDLSLLEVLDQVSAGLEAGLHWQDSFRWETGDEEGALAPRFLPVCFESVELPEQGLPVTAWYSCTDRFHLKLAFVPLAGGPVLQWHLDRERFEASGGREIARQFQALLSGALADPAAPIRSLPLNDAVERHRLIVEANDTATWRPPSVCMPRLFEEQVERAPEAAALCFGGLEISYRELNRRANGWAHLLLAHGVGPGSVVAVFLEPSPLLVEALLAIWKAGGAYLALDVDAPPSLSGRLLSITSCGLLLTQESLTASRPPFEGAVVCLDGVDSLPEVDPGNPGRAAGPGDPAYVVSTSGSSGEPKAVLCQHAGVANYLAAYLAETYRLGGGDTVLQLAAPSFDASVRDIFGPLTVGARVVLLGQEEARSFPALTAAIRRYRVDAILSIVPTLLRALLEELEKEAQGCGSVRLVLLSGERLFAADGARARTVFGGALEIVNQYGPTECTMTSTYFRVPEELGTEAVPLGEPIPNGSVFLLDAALDAVPVGGVGEILLGGPGLACGYLGRPELTAAAFLPNPFGVVPGARVYRTGDLGRRSPDGRLHFLGRRDGQVKVRGVRIELESVESVLRQYPGMRDAAVVAREDGAHESRLIAYLVSDEERRPAVADLRWFLQQSLPEPMVPSTWVFLDQLPLTRTGKLDRAALPEPDEAGPGRGVSYQAARTPAEEVLTQIWAEILGLERVGIHDNFFDLGGHSLLAMRLISRIRQALDVEISLPVLFESPTVAGLATSVEAAHGLQAPPLVPLPGSSSEVPLSFRQERHWFQDRKRNLGRVLELSGPLDVPALARSLDEIVQRQGMLRAELFMVDDQLRQRTVEGVHAWPSLVDISEVPEPLREGVRQQAFYQIVNFSTPLDRAPLLHCFLLRLDRERHWLFLISHPLVFDGWSWVVFYAELSALYDAFLRGAPTPLSPLPIQYSDFVLWQRRWLQGEVLEAELAFWKRKLAGAPSVLEAIADLPERALPLSVGKQPVRIGSALTAALNRLRREHAATMFMLLLSFYKMILSRFTGLDDICVSTMNTCRHRMETERLVGFFASPLGLRTRLPGDASFLQILREVRAVTLEAFARQQDVPLDKLAGDLYPQADLRHIMDVTFGYSFGGREEYEKLALEGLEVVIVPYDPSGGGSELSLQLIEGTEGLSGFIYYNANRFHPGKIAHLAAQYELLAETVVADPEASLETLRDTLARAEGEGWKKKAEEVEAASLLKLRRNVRRSATV
jgi:amino acid adenylation domain-containing protein